MSTTHRHSHAMSLTIGLAAAVIAGCDTEGFGLTGGGDCNLDTGSSSIVGAVTAQYFASTTGDALLSSLTYATDGGPHTIGKPTVPFSARVTLTANRARIQATGSSANGTISISFAVSNEIGPLEQLQAVCP